MFFERLRICVVLVMVGLGREGGSVLSPPVLREQDEEERNVFMVQNAVLFSSLSE